MREIYYLRNTSNVIKSDTDISNSIYHLERLPVKVRKGMSLEIFPILLRKLKYPIVENETVKEIPINETTKTGKTL